MWLSYTEECRSMVSAEGYFWGSLCNGSHCSSDAAPGQGAGTGVEGCTFKPYLTSGPGYGNKLDMHANFCKKNQQNKFCKTVTYNRETSLSLVALDESCTVLVITGNL